MPSLALQFSREQIEESLDHIIQNNIDLQPSTQWNLNYKNRDFPPKEVVRWAARLANLDGWENMTLSGGDNTNGPLKKLGFVIRDKSQIRDPLKELISDYKVLINSTGFDDEIYKWKLVNQFKGRPDINAANFSDEIKSINFSNLIYGVGIGAINHIAREFPEDYRNCFKELYSDALPLSERILTFHDETLALYRRIEPNIKRSHHHDERTMATFLTYHNPLKYSFYKDSFYQKFCKLINEIPKRKGEKYVHYMELVENFITKYIQTDQELLDLVNQHKTQDCFEDTNHKLLAQDILYRTLEKNTRTFTSVVEELKAALIEQSEPPKFQFKKKIGRKNSREWVWMGDSSNNIGDGTAHYELEYDSRDNIIGVCLHFENDKTKDLFFRQIGDDVPENIEWIDWFKSKSLRYKTGVKITEENVVNEIINRIEFMDNELGDRVREIKGSPASNGSSTVDGKFARNKILYGPPGTGKTYNTINKALEIIGINIEGIDRDGIKALYEQKVKDGQIVFTTFHQSMSYEDFIEGIKPDSVNDKVTYNVKDGIFKLTCSAAKNPNHQSFDTAYQNFLIDLSNSASEVLELKTPRGKAFAVANNSNGNLSLHTGPEKEKNGTLTKENIQKQINGEDKFIGWEGYFIGVINHLKEKYNYKEDSLPGAKRFVLIIDEINRGNVSQIFGELITLIEEDKRAGMPEALEVILPYSKEKFSVPDNLYILGTMNTADRSVEALDTALRRRFDFEEMMPNYELSELQGIISGLSITKSKLLNTLNKRVELLKDRDHQIGHSYFIAVKNLDDLLSAFKNKILPLLQEYFYGDYEKIQLVLGKGFVGKDSAQSITFAHHESELDSEYNERERYFLKSDAFANVNSFSHALSLMNIN